MGVSKAHGQIGMLTAARSRSRLVGRPRCPRCKLRQSSRASVVCPDNADKRCTWLVGAGIEWAFLPNWSAKVEYNYLGLDDRTFTVPAASPFLASDTFTQSNRSIQMVKVGINYLFNSYYCVPADPACLLNCRCRE